MVAAVKLDKLRWSSRRVKNGLDDESVTVARGDGRMDAFVDSDEVVKSVFVATSISMSLVSLKNNEMKYIIETRKKKFCRRHGLIKVNRRRQTDQKSRERGLQKKLQMQIVKQRDKL